MNYRIKRRVSDYFTLLSVKLVTSDLIFICWDVLMQKKEEAAFAAAVVVQLCPCSNIVSVNKWLCTARNI